MVKIVLHRSLPPTAANRMRIASKSPCAMALPVVSPPPPRTTISSSPVLHTSSAFVEKGLQFPSQCCVVAGGTPSHTVWAITFSPKEDLNRGSAKKVGVDVFLWKNPLT